MQPFVLVHGAFRGAWSWHKVRRQLQTLGFEVFAPSLTGAGERAHLSNREIGLETWILDVVNLLEYEDLRNVVLVGHSQGGIVAQAAAERAAKRLAHLVFLDAPVLEDGQAAVDAIPPDIRARFGNTSPNVLVPPILLGPGAEFSPSEIEWINARLTPVPSNPSLQKLSLNNDEAQKVPRSYIFCAKTPDFYPAAFTRRRFDAENVSYRLIEAGHDCPLSEPEIVAGILREIAEKQ